MLCEGAVGESQLECVSETEAHLLAHFLNDTVTTLLPVEHTGSSRRSQEVSVVPMAVDLNSSMSVREPCAARRPCRSPTCWARPCWCHTGTTAPRATTPCLALTKALLINTATDLAGGPAGVGARRSSRRAHTLTEGWGRVNVGAALDSTPREYRDQLIADTIGASGITLDADLTRSRTPTSP